ncbi:MAG: hypothetical protein IPP15_22660 [Saprospiraceae bacterium]|uniref:Uncharacterized protein n=1 Tax=Candidatus Opimibacter skivensis TaxID=2982028 RepID=A0A9D7XUP3_9BACT|nr:hypothetical protein [Candidatus Opimibacter skivensis]
MKNILTFLFILSITSVSFGQDRLFAYTYQTNVLNKGDFDIEFQNTFSTGKVGAYSPYVFGQHLDQRVEFEVGLGRKVQTAFYLNSELFNFGDTSSTELNQELKISFSNEWKWKLSDPMANKIGIALYEELEVGGNNFESETKIIFDKRWQKDLVAFNIVGKYEIEKEVFRDGANKTVAEWTHSSPVEFYLGYLHFIKPDIGLGIELRNNNDITKEDGWVNSLVFAGPTAHISVDKFFANISVLPQIANLHKTDAAPGNRDLNGYEAIEIRALIGYSF